MAGRAICGRVKTVSDLIADINAANQAGGSNTITLTAPTTSPYILTTVNNTTNGTNGLPVISGGGTKTAADNLTIVGNSDTIERSTASGTPAFRLFDVASGSALTLDNVTLQGGKAFGSGAAADGGAIYNQGALTLNGATVQDNTAQGSDGAAAAFVTITIHKTTRVSNVPAQNGANAAGGGIWSSGSVTLEGGSKIQGNSAVGGKGGAGGLTVALGIGGVGGDGFGGGLYEAGGSVTARDTTLSGNTAHGGAGGMEFGQTHPQFNSGGLGSGGGMYVAGGTLALGSGTIVESNQAVGGTGGGGGPNFAGGFGGEGEGGGISYVANGTANLDGVELLSNTAAGGQGGSSYAGLAFGGDGLGGGLYAFNGTLTLTSNTVTGNKVVIEGLGSGNEGGGGAGIYNAGSTLTVQTSSSITGNLDGADVDNYGVLYLDSTSTIGILYGHSAVLI
jgi:hypothetical protein